MNTTISRNSIELIRVLDYDGYAVLSAEGTNKNEFYLCLQLPAGEISNGNGYTQGGKTLQNVRFVYSAGELSMYADDVSWLASGAGITANQACLYYFRNFSSSPSRTALPLSQMYSRSTKLATIFFDNDDSLTAIAGTTLTVAWPSGLLFKWKML